MTAGAARLGSLGLLRAMRRGARANACPAALAAIAAAALALRLPPFLHSGLWRDEVATWLFAGLPLRELLPAIRDIDANPPGFYLLEWCVVHTVGSSPSALQLPSLVLSMLLVFVTFRLGQQLHSNAAGLGAACLLAIDPVAIREASDARCYTLLAVLCAWATLAALRLRRDRSPRSALMLALAASAAMYAHYTGIVYVAGLFAATLIAARLDRRTVALLGAAGAFAALLYVPWVPAFVLHQRVGYPVLPHDVAPLDRLRTLVDPLRAGLALWGALVVIWIADRLWAGGARPNPRLGWAVAVVAAVQALFLWRLILNGRYAFSTLPLCYAAAAAIALHCASPAGGTPLRRKFFLVCVLLASVMYGAASLRIMAAYEPSLLGPKSGVTPFVATLAERSDILVVAAPDYYAPTLFHALAGRRIALDAFARAERPQWFRFADGYEALWSDPRAVDTAYARITRRPGLRTIFFVTQPPGKPAGVIDYHRSGALLARLERRFAVRADTFYGGSWEPIRVVTLERRSR